MGQLALSVALVAAPNLDADVTILGRLGVGRFGVLFGSRPRTDAQPQL
jgi:hypothetical protein